MDHLCVTKERPQAVQVVDGVAERVPGCVTGLVRVGPIIVAPQWTTGRGALAFGARIDPAEPIVHGAPAGAASPRNAVGHARPHRTPDTVRAPCSRATASYRTRGDAMVQPICRLVVVLILTDRAEHGGWGKSIVDFSAAGIRHEKASFGSTLRMVTSVGLPLAVSRGTYGDGCSRSRGFPCSSSPRHRTRSNSPR